MTTNTTRVSRLRSSKLCKRRNSFVYVEEESVLESLRSFDTRLRHRSLIPQRGLSAKEGRRTRAIARSIGAAHTLLSLFLLPSLPQINPTLSVSVTRFFSFFFIPISLSLSRLPLRTNGFSATLLPLVPVRKLCVLFFAFTSCDIATNVRDTQSVGTE